MPMKMTFRWYGDNDPVTLQKIKQIPTMTGIVSAIYDVPVGEVWPEEKIAAESAPTAPAEFTADESDYSPTASHDSLTDNDERDGKEETP